jgi:hypothetical protein
MGESQFLRKFSTAACHSVAELVIAKTGMDTPDGRAARGHRI